MSATPQVTGSENIMAIRTRLGNLRSLTCFVVMHEEHRRSVQLAFPDADVFYALEMSDLAGRRFDKIVVFDRAQRPLSTRVERWYVDLRLRLSQPDGEIYYV